MTGRPVKVLYRRDESLRFHPKRHATIIRVKTGATRDGKLVAVEAELYGDSGAYASLGEKVMTRATTHATGPYVTPHAKIDCYAMYTNNAPCGAFRGFGVTQSAFAVESNMDILARQLGIDPVEFRRRLLMPGSRHRRILDAVAEQAGWGTPLPAGMARGVAVHESFGSWLAQVAEVSNDNGRIRVHKVVCAIDCGLAVNPEGIVAQVESRYDLDTLTHGPAQTLETNDIGRVRLRLASDLPIEPYDQSREGGSFLVIHPQGGATLAAGIARV